MLGAAAAIAACRLPLPLLPPVLLLLPMPTPMPLAPPTHAAVGTNTTSPGPPPARRAFWLCAAAVAASL